MPRNSDIIRNVLDTQARIFRLAERDHGLTRKAISLDSGIAYDSICNYAKGETQMPVAALYALIGVIPNDLLSLLLPVGHAIVRAPEALDHDELEEAARAYLAEKGDAHRSDSEAGREIGPNEAIRLTAKATHLKAVA